jgi:hypothetical protein
VQYAVDATLLGNVGPIVLEIEAANAPGDADGAFARRIGVRVSSVVMIAKHNDHRAAKLFAVLLRPLGPVPWLGRAGRVACRRIVEAHKRSQSFSPSAHAIARPSSIACAISSAR